MKSLGAVPVSIGFGELYQALERGTVDATINYTPFVKAYKHFEVADHLTLAAMGQPLSYGPGINLKLWKSMPENIRKIMTDRSIEFIDQYAQRYLADVDTATADLTAGIKGKKVQFHVLDPVERKKWAAASVPFIADWKKKVAKKGIDGDKIYATFQKIRQKWEQELATKNYPWKR